jgi:hypothetical protein
MISSAEPSWVRGRSAPGSASIGNWPWPGTPERSGTWPGICGDLLAPGAPKRWRGTALVVGAVE